MPLKSIRHLRWAPQMYLWGYNTAVNLDEKMNYDFELVEIVTQQPERL